MAPPTSTATVLPARCGDKTPPRSARPSERGAGGRRGGSSAPRPSRSPAFAVSRLLGGGQRQRWHGDSMPTTAGRSGLDARCESGWDIAGAGAGAPTIDRGAGGCGETPGGDAHARAGGWPAWPAKRGGPWGATHRAPRPAVRSQRTRRGGGRLGGAVAPPRRAPLRKGGEQTRARAWRRLALALASGVHQRVRDGANHSSWVVFCVNNTPH